MDLRSEYMSTPRAPLVIVLVSFWQHSFVLVWSQSSIPQSLSTDVGGPQEKIHFFQIASGSILSIPIYLKTCLYGPCKFPLKQKWPLPYLGTPQSQRFFHLSQLTNLHAFRARFSKVKEHALDHFKYVKLLLYIFERRVQSFATKFWHQVGQQGRYSGGGPR